MACIYTLICGIFPHMIFQASSTGDRTLLPNFYEHYSSGRKLPKCSRHTPPQRNVADQIIPCSAQRSHDIPTMVQRPTRLAKLENPSWSSLITSAQIDVCSDACYPFVTHATATFLTTKRNRLIWKQDNKKQIKSERKELDIDFSET